APTSRSAYRSAYRRAKEGEGGRWCTIAYLQAHQDGAHQDQAPTGAHQEGEGGRTRRLQASSSRRTRRGGVVEFSTKGGVKI
ncbi:MAG: hypothetical protein D6823_07015, partial [Chloroflexi bacterium]